MKTQKPTWFQQHSFFKALYPISFRTQVLEKLLKNEKYIRQNGHYQVGRKKECPITIFWLTKQQKYRKTKCQACDQEKGSYYLYHTCTCRRCENSYGCESGGTKEIYFICNQCDDPEYQTKNTFKYFKSGKKKIIVLNNQPYKKTKPIAKQKKQSTLDELD